MGISPPLSLFVAPRWELLNHPGFIVARFLPDKVTPCPYLQPGSVLRVIARRIDLDARRNVVQSRLDQHNFSPMGGGSPHELIFGRPAASSLVLLPHELTFGRPAASSLAILPPSDLRPAMGLDPVQSLETSSSLAFIAAMGLVPVQPRETSSSLVAANPLALLLSSPEVPLLHTSRRKGESERMMFSPELRSGERLEDEVQSEVHRVQSDGITPCLGEESDDNDLSEESDDPNDATSDGREEPLHKRSRPNEIQEGAYDDEAPITDVMISRRERTALLKMFRHEQKMERRRYKSLVKREWEEEIAEEKENFPKEGDGVGSSSVSSVFRPVDPEMLAEAREDYLFDKMVRHDGDAAHLLVHFRASLRVVSELDLRNEGDAFSLRRDRTNELFQGLRRVYFGEKERQLPAPDPARSHQEEMAILQREIDDLERRRGRHRVPEDSGRPFLPFRDEDDGPDPPPLWQLTPTLSLMPELVGSRRFQMFQILLPR
jgi:hypothetical protein